MNPRNEKDAERGSERTEELPSRVNHGRRDKLIPPLFFRCGSEFRLLERAGDIALFEKRKPTHSRKSFEVMIVHQHAEMAKDAFSSGRK